MQLSSLNLRLQFKYLAAGMAVPAGLTGACGVYAQGYGIVLTLLSELLLLACLAGIFSARHTSKRRLDASSLTLEQSAKGDLRAKPNIAGLDHELVLEKIGGRIDRDGEGWVEYDVPEPAGGVLRGKTSFVRKPDDACAIDVGIYRIRDASHAGI